ncbi:hypothetical protein D3C75_648510 [compost metagenome]
MNKKPLTHASAALLALALLLGTGGNPASAEPQPSSSVMARPEVMPYVTLVDSFTLYSGPETRPDQAAGSLSPLQSVRLSPIEQDKLLSISNMEKLEVETWLGPVWINLKEGAYQFNQLEAKEETLNLLQETVLFDAPGKPSPYSLAPQQVQAVASINACAPYTPCYNPEFYYLIHTAWLGDMWIRPYHYAEKYKGVQAAGAIPVSAETPVYLYPYEQPLENEPKIKPQVIMPLAKYTQYGRMLPAAVWYKIDTPLGERWIAQNGMYGLGVEGVEPWKETLHMPVPFRLKNAPYGTLLPDDEKQPPQDLQAIGKHGDWVMVLVNGEGRWVNPSVEIAISLTGDLEHDRTLGVKEYKTPIELNEFTLVADYPSPGEVINNMELLVFTKQEVVPERVWDSPNGTRWYYISTWRGPKWVMNP